MIVFPKASMVSRRGGKGRAAGGGKGAGAGAEEAPTDNGAPIDAADEVTECRFKHLLEPIRDLALNWNIDIAQELEHYLGQLELVQVTLDGGGSFLNFAEAALLIQGTTCVYSRKVEYLHRLVLQVLDVIDHKLSKELRKDAAAEGEQDAEGAFPSDPEFISLDDIPEAKSAAIDMAEKNDDTREGADDDLTGGPLVVMMNIEVDNDNPGVDPV
jgi:condensin-2 complex subunit H2